MSKRFIYLFPFFLVLGLALTSAVEAADPSLVGWWRFDEGSGSVATDSSGNGLDGTIEGATWTAGQSGSALEFDGTDDAVRIPEFATGEAQTITAWIKIDSVSGGQKQMFNGNGPPHMNFELATGAIEGRVYTGSSNITLTGPEVPVGDWTHVAWAYDHPGNRSELFIDGLSVALGEETAPLAHTSPSVIGRHPTSTTATFLGVIDDVHIYSRALIEAEIQQVMTGAPPGSASNPSPANEATDVPRDVVLSWEPGEFAAPTNGHKVYFGENFDDVNDATGGVAQTAAGYTPAQRLDFSKTYYWRVDEVNAPPTSHIE